MVVSLSKLNGYTQKQEDLTPELLLKK